MISYEQKLSNILSKYKRAITKPNKGYMDVLGVFERFESPVCTPDNIPPYWVYDFDKETNPYLMGRLGVNCTLNPGAIALGGKISMIVRVEGYDRKSFFAICDSDSGIDKFVFRKHPCVIPTFTDDETNIYDMRLVAHEDGYIYGLFCVERKMKDVPESDQSSADAQCGIVRSKDMETWERLPDLKTPSPQQRNVVLHPEFVDGKYGFYTRPQDGFISAGSGGGIAWGVSDTMENPVIEEELVIDKRRYHTVNELKNGQGPAPIKTKKGWLHIAHGVRNTAAGLRYVIYAFMTDLEKPWILTHKPNGFLIAPQGDEYVGDVGNVAFCNGAAVRGEDVYIYYASSDTRCHVARTTLDMLTDYVVNTPEDPYYTDKCVEQRIELIDKNLEIIKNSYDKSLMELI